MKYGPPSPEKLCGPGLRQCVLARPILSLDGLESPALSGQDGYQRGRESACLRRLLTFAFQGRKSVGSGPNRAGAPKDLTSILLHRTTSDGSPLGLRQPVWINPGTTRYACTPPVTAPHQQWSASVQVIGVSSFDVAIIAPCQETTTGPPE